MKNLSTILLCLCLAYSPQAFAQEPTPAEPSVNVNVVAPEPAPAPPPAPAPDVNVHVDAPAPAAAPVVSEKTTKETSNTKIVETSPPEENKTMLYVLGGCIGVLALGAIVMAAGKNR